MASLPSQSNLEWSRVTVSTIEDLQDAILGAGLRTGQMSSAPVRGSLAFTQHDGISYASGAINGKVSLTGPLSETLVTLGAGLVLPPGTRHWLNEVTSGDVGVFMPGDEHDALYVPGSLYAAVTLSADRIGELAAEFDLVLGLRELSGSGICKRPLPEHQRAEITRLFRLLHKADVNNRALAGRVGKRLLDTLIAHFARLPRAHVGLSNPRGHTRIVTRARDFIDENLANSLSVDAIAKAVGASPRTLHRAFVRVLDETPYSYVQKLRLNYIRQEIIKDAEMTQSLAGIANQGGLSELGRLAGWYRDLYGELPSETRKRAQSRLSTR